MLLLLVVLLCANIYSLVKHLNSLKNELNLTLVGIPRTVSLRISPYLIFNCQSQNSDISCENTPWMLIWTQHSTSTGRAGCFDITSALLYYPIWKGHSDCIEAKSRHNFAVHLLVESLKVPTHLKFMDKVPKLTPYN